MYASGRALALACAQDEPAVVLAVLNGTRPSSATEGRTMVTLQVDPRELESSSLPVKTFGALDSLPPHDMRRQFVLQPRFLDITTRKLMDQVALDAEAFHKEQQPLANALLCKTSNFAQRVPVPEVAPPPANHHLRDSYDQCKMTTSQQQTFNHVCGNTLTIVWGPPGAGKTHFLASTLCRMLIAAIAGDKQMHIFVTAYTNEALNLLLRKVRPSPAARPAAPRPPCVLTLPCHAQVASMLDGLDDAQRPPVCKVSSSHGDVVVGSIVRRRGTDHNLRFRVVAKPPPPGELRVQQQLPRHRRTGSAWLDDTSKQEVSMQESEVTPVHDYDVIGNPTKGRLQRRQVVWGATVYQLDKFHSALKKFDIDASDGYFDVLVVDEASQMPLSHVLPPLGLLRKPAADGGSDGGSNGSGAGTNTGAAPPAADAGGGRLVVVGDPKQMGTVLQCKYPPNAELVDGTPPPHFSLLSWLRDAVPDKCVQLKENHRMTKPLAAFTQSCLGYSDYKECFEGGCPCHASTRGVLPLKLPKRPATPEQAASTLEDKCGLYTSPAPAALLFWLLLTVWPWVPAP